MNHHEALFKNLTLEPHKKWAHNFLTERMSTSTIAVNLGA